MGYQSNDNYFTRPFCLCCGSRELITLDVYIAENNDYEQRSQLKEQRLWSSISDLDELALDSFVAEAVSDFNIEDSGELEMHLYSHLRFAATSASVGQVSYIRVEPVELDEIDRSCIDDLLPERKLAFMRLWDSFDESTKASFLTRATQADRTFGSGN